MARVKMFRDHTAVDHIRSYHLSSYRVWKDRIPHLESILCWCDAHGRSFNSVINSVLPAIDYALNNTTFKHTGALYCNMDFGDVKLCINDKD